MQKPSLHTRWGGTGVHAPIISRPLNSAGDLELKSEVFTQSFFSLHRHEYHYKAENTSAGVSGFYCNMRVEWLGPKVTWSRLGPGITPVVRQSFFSPHQIATAANADVLAGGLACTPRQVAGERADAYVPWLDTKVVTSLLSLVKDLVEGGKVLALASSISWGDSESIQIHSSMLPGNPSFIYSLEVQNRKEVAIVGRIGGGLRSAEESHFEIRPGAKQTWTIRSQGPPKETEAFFEYQVPGYEDLGLTKFPIGLLTPN